MEQSSKCIITYKCLDDFSIISTKLSDPIGSQGLIAHLFFVHLLG